MKKSQPRESGKYTVRDTMSRTVGKPKNKESPRQRVSREAKVPERKVRAVAELDKVDPQVVERIASGKQTIKQAAKQTKRAAKAEKKSVPVNAPDATDRFKLIRADIASVNGEVAEESFDWIITDPPYPKEHLPLFTDLAEFADCTLKPGGSLLAMVGQSYLPEVFAALASRLTYHWTLAYLTPGGQAVQLWDRKVNTFWKPVLWFVKGKYAGDWIGDVCKSAVNDNDKKHHHWGQSESGMADIIDRFTYPGQTICDPFVGGGTTAVVSVARGRGFVGIDVDADAIETTKRRIAELKL